MPAEGHVTIGKNAKFNRDSSALDTDSPNQVTESSTDAG